MAVYTEALAAGTLFTEADSLDQMTAFRDIDPVKGGMMTGYGLGVGVLPLRAAHAWGHTGETMGYTSLFMTIPEHDINLIYLTNGRMCSAIVLTSAIREPLLESGDE